MNVLMVWIHGCLDETRMKGQGPAIAVARKIEASCDYASASEEDSRPALLPFAHGVN
jgi:hypothetical protein